MELKIGRLYRKKNYAYLYLGVYTGCKYRIVKDRLDNPLLNIKVKHLYVKINLGTLKGSAIFKDIMLDRYDSLEKYLMTSYSDKVPSCLAYDLTDIELGIVYRDTKYESVDFYKCEYKDKIRFEFIRYREKK